MIQINFYPDSDKEELIESSKQYQNIWNKDGQKIIKLSETKSDTYLYKDKSKLMELCVIKDMQPDFSTGQALMACDDFDVKQDENKIICEINGVEFYVELRSGLAS